MKPKKNNITKKTKTEVNSAMPSEEIIIEDSTQVSDETSAQKEKFKEFLTTIPFEEEKTFKEILTIIAEKNPEKDYFYCDGTHSQLFTRGFNRKYSSYFRINNLYFEERFKVSILNRPNCLAKAQELNLKNKSSTNSDIAKIHLDSDKLTSQPPKIPNVVPVDPSILGKHAMETPPIINPGSTPQNRNNSPLIDDVVERFVQEKKTTKKTKVEDLVTAGLKFILTQIASTTDKTIYLLKDKMDEIPHRGIINQRYGNYFKVNLYGNIKIEVLDRAECNKLIQEYQITPSTQKTTLPAQSSQELNFPHNFSILKLNNQQTKNTDSDPNIRNSFQFFDESVNQKKKLSPSEKEENIANSLKFILTEIAKTSDNHIYLTKEKIGNVSPSDLNARYSNYFKIIVRIEVKIEVINRVACNELLQKLDEKNHIPSVEENTPTTNTPISITSNTLNTTDTTSVNRAFDKFRFQNFKSEQKKESNEFHFEDNFNI